MAQSNRSKSASDDASKIPAAEAKEAIKMLQLAVGMRVSMQHDAIDATMDLPARKTQAKALRNAAGMATFRSELIDGLIRVDSVRGLIDLCNSILERWPSAK